SCQQGCIRPYHASSFRHGFRRTPTHPAVTDRADTDGPRQRRPRRASQGCAGTTSGHAWGCHTATIGSRQPARMGAPDLSAGVQACAGSGLSMFAIRRWWRAWIVEAVFGGGYSLIYSVCLCLTETNRTRQMYIKTLIFAAITLVFTSFPAFAATPQVHQLRTMTSQPGQSQVALLVDVAHWMRAWSDKTGFEACGEIAQNAK